MTRAPRISSAQAIALPRTKGSIGGDRIAAGVAVLLLLVALLAP